MGSMKGLPTGRILDYVNDGTVVTFRHGLGTVQPFNQAEVANLLSMDNGTGKVTTSNDLDDSHYIYLIFPVDRTITGFFYNPYVNSPFPISYYFATSTNTTGEGTGTWTDQETWNHGSASTTMPPTDKLRNQQFLTSFPAAITCKGVRIRVYYASSSHYAVTWRSLILWVSDLDEGLHMWHPTLDQAATPDEMDFADTDTWSLDFERTREFRVKNTHSLLTADSVVVGTDISSIGDLDTEMTFDLNGGGYQPQVTIPSLAPGAISDVITMKRPSPLNYTPNTARMTIVRADATTWS